MLSLEVVSQGVLPLSCQRRAYYANPFLKRQHYLGFIPGRNTSLLFSGRSPERYSDARGALAQTPVEIGWSAQTVIPGSGVPIPSRSIRESREGKSRAVVAPFWQVGKTAKRQAGISTRSGKGQFKRGRLLRNG
jgi:hypothetical protein